MPPTKTPTNSTNGVPAPPLPPAVEATSEFAALPLQPSTGRYAELDHTELVKLLDSLDDDRSKSRFRESIYISVIVYLALAWLVIYGPRVLFHQGQIVDSAQLKKQKEMAYLDLKNDPSKRPPPKSPKALADKSAVAQTKHPTLDKRTLEQLQAMRRAGEQAAPQAAPSPAPTPSPAPAPAQAAPPQQQAQAAPTPPPPAAPTPQPRVTQPAPTSSIPDAPKPNFSVPTSPGQMVADAGKAAARQHGTNMGDGGQSAPLAHQGQNTGLEVLSDTQGVDFGPYIRRLLRILKEAWYPLIPEETRPPLNKEGSTLIRFTIQQNGVVSFMHLDGSTHDQAIDRAAWGAIQAVGQFPPLPSEFKGPNLDLRIQFIISHDGSAAR